MVGRGTRLDPTTGKLMFRVYDYTNATRLFGATFTTRPPREGRERPEVYNPERVVVVEGFDVHVTAAGRYIMTSVDGKAMPVTVEQYRERLATKLVEAAPTLDRFRATWINPSERRTLLGSLPDGGRSADLVRSLAEMNAFDLYDVLGELGYGLEPHTRSQRAFDFAQKHRAWLTSMPPSTTATIKAVVEQFARAGTQGLENPTIFQTPDVMNAGGLAALRAFGNPSDVLRETKERMFAV
jgi:type I restriction enzyme R subunit